MLQASATRQELLKLKRRIKVASRGKKLLEDKADALTRQLLVLQKELKQLEEKLEGEYSKVSQNYKLAFATTHTDYLLSLGNTTEVKIDIELSFKKLMGITIPKLESKVSGSPYVYSLMETNEYLAASVEHLLESLPTIIKLLEIKQTVMVIEKELEKTNRRVNALEHIVVPRMVDQSSLIRKKLEENARSEKVSLMRAKKLVIS